MSTVVTLYRPVGPAELQLVRDSGFCRFPPRLPEQPIFYPVTNLHYAREIASKWNVRDDGSGYVVRFEVDAEYLARYEVRRVGARHHEEYWIPAEELAEFNAHIVGPIAVVEEFSASGGAREPRATLDR